MNLRSQLEELTSTSATVQEVIQHEVPMLCSDWGAKDEDALVHALGVSLLAALGRSLGHVAIPEYPVPRAVRWQHKLVRVDSAWFHRESRKLILLGEFERFSRETALEKLTNLFVAANGCEEVPQILLLCLWSLDATPVNTPWLKVEEALPVRGGPPVSKPAASEVYGVHAVFGRRGEHFHFLRFRRLV